MNAEAVVGAESQALTYESIVERILSFLASRDVELEAKPIPWEAFARLANRIHTNYHVPSTTLTPIMRRLLFAIGYVARSRRVVGVGTYVGYGFSWLLRDRSDAQAAPFCEAAMGIDIDADANETARRNCTLLQYGERLQFDDADAIQALQQWSGVIDLLYIDVDSPQRGKSDYQLILKAALPYLHHGSIILAHDPVVPRFRSAFEAYHAVIEQSDRLLGPWVLPVDRCGLSIAAAK